MASRTSAIIAELLTALRVEHASVDLRTTEGTKRVLCPAMTMLPPASAPLLVISAPQVRGTYESAIGQYKNSAEHEWSLFVASTHDDPEIRASIALEAAHDVIAALQAAHFDDSFETLFSLTELLITLDDVIGEELEDSPGYGTAYGKITWVDYPTGPGI